VVSIFRKVKQDSGLFIAAQCTRWCSERNESWGDVFA